MILPIVAYGHPVLRKMCEDITPEYPKLQELLANMWETMYASSGVGLAAPQINRPIRLFVVDSEQIINSLDEEERAEYPGDNGVKQVFINAHIVETAGDEWAYNEGCLSIPKVREDVYRPESLRLRYVDENFQPREQTFTGITARVIFHEYDHIDGKLFIDHLKPLKRRMIKGKLEDIVKGKVSVDYKMVFHK
ncbi:peptide deformylase [Chitinophaga sp. CF118]|uniref:peptide deformylase n=1 Tax=Chitinophaga sp. CF118 TaxID=1884367 RepID=UPI0008ED19C4|nr:peptide deformylase [Chitinophaga sp. CF118]SFE13906.1 peptide deformylase [Chitinophaga sp. CF118]